MNFVFFLRDMNFQVFGEYQLYMILHRASKKMPIPVGRRVVKTCKKFNSTETGSVKLHSFARWNGVTLQIVSQPHFDLEETPGRWSHQESFREQQAFE